MNIPMAAGCSCVKLSIKCDCLLAFDMISYLSHSPQGGWSMSAASRNKAMGKPQMPHLVLAYAVIVSKAQSNPYIRALRKEPRMLIGYFKLCAMPY